MISHYARLLEMVKPTRTAILINCRIVLEGGPDLYEKVDKQGYEWLKYELNINVEKEVGATMNDVSIGACATRIGTSKDGK